MTTTTEEPAVSGEVVPYVPPAGVMEEYRPRIMMTADEAKEMDSQLRATMLAVLKEGTDYGTIPGAGDKKNLLKPGAEKLLQWFGFGSRSAEVKTERDNPDFPSGIADKARRIGVTYRTEVTKTIPGQGEVVVATCEGYAGYDEDRYYLTEEEARRKAEEKERKWAAKDRRQPKPEKWENAAEYRAPWNTLIKMSQKRSYVGAAIDATGAAGLFTQDMDDTAPAAHPGAQALAAAGRTAIGRLPQAVRDGLDAWYQALNWPGPDEWDAEQWCTALVQAGKLSEAGATPAQDAPAAPAANGNGQHPAATPEDNDWHTPADQLTEYHTAAVSFGTEEEGRKLFRAVAASAKARDITREDAKQLQDIILARVADLRAATEKPVEGVVVPGLDPDDEWAVKVADILSHDDAVVAAANVRQGMKSGHIAKDRGERILAAIEVRTASLAGTGAAA